MKKIIAILAALFLMASTFCVTTFAEESQPIVMEISGLKNDGKTIVSLNYWTKFADGWECAVDFAEDDDFMEEQDLDRIIVDFYADWNANDDGEFGKSSWDGFQFSTIYVPSDTRITINLNGHTINRGLGDNNEYDGEVICVNDNADLIINGGKSGDPFVKPGENPDNIPLGTIKGGNSDNGAGGIHIQDGARVTLNNVNITENAVDDDDGAGIAAYDGAVLTMNGGSISKNVLWSSFMSVAHPYGALYLNDATAYLNNVEIEGNVFKGDEWAEGVAIYVDDSTLVAENCTIRNNGYKTSQKNPWEVVSIHDSRVEFNNCVFEANGTKGDTGSPETITMRGGTLIINKSIFRNNHSKDVIRCDDGLVQVTETLFENNPGNVYDGAADEGSFFEKCTFTTNYQYDKYRTFIFDEGNKLDFIDCVFDENTTFNDRSRATFDGKVVGSIFGEGSLTMIVALLALIASGVSIFLVVYYNKKKGVPVTANGADESDSEE